MREVVANEVAGFGAVLRRYRVAAAISQEELAERAGLSGRGISDLERGVRREPRLETVRLLADALGLAPEERAILLASRGSAPAGLQEAAAETGTGRSPLPSPPTALVGREREVAAAVDLLRRPDVRLVTLTGPGGVGKTRLALAVAMEVEPSVADGVRFVELAQVREPALLAATLAQSVGLQPMGGESPEAALKRLLGARRTLLVLDNFEQILVAAPLVAALLAACPDLKVLATSRAPLRLRGERELAVPPLGLPDRDRVLPCEAMAGIGAVRLFVERARDVQPVFGLTAANASVVAEIVRRLDGLPLAIELAAARTKILPPDMLLDRLAHRFLLLTEGPRDLPERQQTMHAAIAWSYDLLSPAEQALFRRLSVFDGGFSLDAAEAVAGQELTPHSVFDVLSSLVDKSLLHPQHGAGGGARFAMLETIREFGQEKLAAHGEESAARTAHATYFLAAATRMATAWYGSGFAECLAWWTPEHANLRAALGWLETSGSLEEALELAAAVVFFWYYHGPVSEGRGWLERLTRSGDPKPTAARAKALEWAANLAGKEGDIAGAASLAAEAAPVARTSGDRRLLGFTLCTLGQYLRQRGRAAETPPLFAEALSIFREFGPEEFAAVPLMNLGLLAADSGDHEQARAYGAEALDLRLGAGNAPGAAIVRQVIADLARARGDLPAARALYRENIAVLFDLADAAGVADSLTGLVLTAVDDADMTLAVRLLAAATAAREALGAAIHAGQREEQETFLARARAALGEPVFATTWEAGRALPIDRAIVEAEALTEAASGPGPAAPFAPPPGVEAPVAAPPGAAHGLSPRELEVLRLVAAGLTDRQIGEALFISHTTARTHVGKVLAKLEVSTRTAAATYAHQHGLI